jgi:hypothetical protein
MEVQLTFEEPEFDINEDVIDESQLDVPDRIDVDGIEFKELKNSIEKYELNLNNTNAELKE